MKALLACGLVVCFAVFASAQAGAPGFKDPPLRSAPSVTTIRAKSLTVRDAGGGVIIRSEPNGLIELLGPHVVEVDEAEVFVATDTAVLRGQVTMRPGYR